MRPVIRDPVVVTPLSVGPILVELPAAASLFPEGLKVAVCGLHRNATPVGWVEPRGIRCAVKGLRRGARESHRSFVSHECKSSYGNRDHSSRHHLFYIREAWVVFGFSEQKRLGGVAAHRDLAGGTVVVGRPSLAGCFFGRFSR